MLLILKSIKLFKNLKSIINPSWLCGYVAAYVSIFYEIIFRKFFIYFLVDVADIKNY
jgi:hypothetical protein